MFYKKLFSLLLIPLLWGQVSNAHFYSHAIFKVGNKIYVCLRDWHTSNLKENQVNLKQKLEVLSWAKALNASLVVEDINTKEGYQISLPVLSWDSQNFTPIDQLASWAYHSKIPVANSEFRRISILSERGSVTSKDAFKSLTKILQEIKQYNDTPELNAIYLREVQVFERLLVDNARFFDLFINSEESIKQIKDRIYRIPYSNFSAEIDNILGYLGFQGFQLYMPNPMKVSTAIELFTSKILDLRLLHDIYNQKTDIVFICAGGAHINSLAHYFIHNLNGTFISGQINRPNQGQEPHAINVAELLAQQFPSTQPTINDFALKLLYFKNKYPFISTLLLNNKTFEVALGLTPVLGGFGTAILAVKICDFLKIAKQQKLRVALSAYAIATLGLYVLAYKFYNDNSKLIAVNKNERQNEAQKAASSVVVNYLQPNAG